MTLTLVNSMKHEPPKKNSTHQPISKPNPPTEEMIKKAQFVDKTYKWNGRVNLVFDIETDGLLYNVTTIHCLAIHDLETKETYFVQRHRQSRTDFARLQRLQDADSIIGHNIIGYDLTCYSQTL